MEYLALFTTENDFEKIMEVLYRSFGMERTDHRNTLKLENEKEIFEIQVLSNFMGENFEKYIREQKNMVLNFFAQVENCDEDIRMNLINFINRAQTYVYIQLTGKGDNEVSQRESLGRLQTAIQSAMVQIGGVFVVSQEHTAFNEKGQVILNDNGHSDLDSYFPFSYEDNPAFLKNCTQRQKTRRNDNMKYLFEQGIYVCELPINDDDENVELQDKEAVVKRILGLLAVSLYSEALLNPEVKMSVTQARAFVRDVLSDYSVEDMSGVLTARELAYVEDDNSEERERINFSWHYENLYTLEWVLGLVEWNFPDDICDVKGTVHILRQFHSIEDMCQRTAMRSKKEILDKADLIYRMDWAAVEARIHGMTGPAGLEHGVVQARHKTLNWMIRFQNAEWDEVDTPT